MVISLFKHQKEFLLSRYIFTGLVGGFGSGKSYIGTLKTVSKLMEYPSVNVAYYLPTYRLIKDIAIPRFKEILDLHNISYTLNKQDFVFETPFGNIIMRSMSDPEFIVGYEVGYSLIDEADLLPTDKMNTVFIKVVARNRKPLPDGSANCLDFVSTPEGFKFLWKFFVKKKTDKKKIIRAKTSDNKTLPDSYFETLFDEYSEQQIEAYLNGEFVNLTSGTVYRNFDRDENHSDRTIRNGDVLHIGMDFNITNMSAVINVFDAEVKTAVAEIINVYDTSEMITKIKELYSGYNIVIYPDASGKNRKTSGKSDVKLLKQAGFKVRTLTKNPFVRDRVNAVNSAFCNNKGERNYFVNSNLCPSFAEALEQQVYKNGDPDKTGGFDHVNDAAGYFITGSKKQKRQGITAS